MENNLMNFLVWLSAGGCIVATSWILEQMTWFQQLVPARKRIIQFSASAILGILALIVITYVPAATLAVLEPYFLMVSTVFASVFLNQMAHQVDPGRRK